MKNSLHYFKIAAFAFLVSFFANSCNKKTSDDPTPATSASGSTEEKPSSPDVSKRNPLTFPAATGAGVPPTTPVAVSTPDGFSVTVADQAQQRGGSGESGLQNLLGLGSGQLRMQEDNIRKWFGWYVSDMTVNGVSYSAQQIESKGLRSAIFLNCDSSGYYWQFNFKDKKWKWGTWGVDQTAKYLAFDFEADKKPKKVWQISNSNYSRLVVNGVYDLNEDQKPDTVIIGLNAYDLKKNKFNGQLVTNDDSEKLLGTWNLKMVDSTFINYESKRTFLRNGNWVSYDAEGGVPTYSYGNWLEDLCVSACEPIFHVTFLKNGNLVTESYSYNFNGNFLNLTLKATTGPDNAIGASLYLQR